MPERTESGKPSLSIVIVNWNTGTRLRDCVESIAGASRTGFILESIVVVDNASTDSSLSGLERFDCPLRIIRNEINRGFAAACNQGVGSTSGKYLLFLNPDTVLMENSLAEPVSFMERNENSRIGICGIQLIDESGSECLSHARFPDVPGFFLQSLGIRKLKSAPTGADPGHSAGCREYSVVDQVIGAFFVVRRTLYDLLAGFDERFFVYFEEVDFSLRAFKAGWQSVCLQGVNCVHAEGGSSGNVKAERLFYSLRSRLLYCFKHFDPFASAVTVLLTLLVESTNRIFYSIIKGGPGDFRTRFEGIEC